MNARLRRRFWTGLLAASAGAMLGTAAPVAPAAAQRSSVQGSAGRDAGSYRSLIGTTYDSNGRPAALKNWSYVGGGGFDETSDPELAIVHFRRGKNDVVVFHSRPRSGTKAKILDVLSLQPVPTGRVLIPGDCRYDGEDRPTIIGLARLTDDALLSRIDRAWYVDRDRLRLSRIDVGLIDCYAPGQ